MYYLNFTVCTLSYKTIYHTLPYLIKKYTTEKITEHKHSFKMYESKKVTMENERHVNATRKLDNV